MSNSILLGIIGSLLAIVCSALLIGASKGDTLMILGMVLIILWNGYFIVTCIQGNKVADKVNTIMKVYFIFQLLIAIPILLLFANNGINLSCRDCQGAAGILALFFLGGLIIGLITLIIQIIALVRIRRALKGS